MNHTLSKVWGYRWVLRSLFSTLRFNFHYLPLRQAVKLPILLYKPRFVAMKGKVRINAPVRFGMIQMGCDRVHIYSNTGVSWENKGGTVCFNGRAAFGNDTFLSFGSEADVEFGDDVSASAGMKFVSVKRVQIGNKVAFGWGCLLTDTNFHPIIRMRDGSFAPPTREIVIGDNCWFASKCNILPGVTVPERCIFGICTTVSHGAPMTSYRVHRPGGGIEVGHTDVYRDIHGPNDHA